MILTSRKFEVFKDFKDLCDFLKGHNIDEPKFGIIPKNGVVVEGAGQKLGFGFIYNTDSCLCFIDCVVKNPKIKDRALTKAVLGLVICDIIKLAKLLGKRVICCSVGHKVLNEIALENNFVPWDRKSTYYTKGL